MKILSLNTWHGECGPELRAFLLSQLETVDVFCLQEANGESIDAIIAELFSGSKFYVANVTKDGGVSRGYCLYTIAKAPIRLISQHALLEVSDHETGQAFATELEVGGGRIVVVNVHGMPYPGDKLDSEGRLRQTSQIIDWLSTRDVPAVVCGDFNLEPATKSVQDFAAAGYQDLIGKYQIATTRNHLAWAKWPDNVQLFADYTFVSPGLAVTDFSVPDLDVSDHLPMIIELET